MAFVASLLRADLNESDPRLLSHWLLCCLTVMSYIPHNSRPAFMHMHLQTKTWLQKLTKLPNCGAHFILIKTIAGGLYSICVSVCVCVPRSETSFVISAPSRRSLLSTRFADRGLFLSEMRSTAFLQHSLFVFYRVCFCCSWKLLSAELVGIQKGKEIRESLFYTHTQSKLNKYWLNIF